MGVFEPEPRRSGSTARKGLFKPNTELMSAHNSFCSREEWARGPPALQPGDRTSDFSLRTCRRGGVGGGGGEQEVGGMGEWKPGQVRLQGPAVQTQAACAQR